MRKNYALWAHRIRLVMWPAGLALVATLVGTPQDANAAPLVTNGNPVATVVVVPPAAPHERNQITDQRAAELLVEWVQKMTGATLPIAATAPDGAPAVYIGAAALQKGLKVDDIKSISNEGLRIISDDRQVLIGGQSSEATMRGVARFLEAMGCRYYMDHPLGQVYPETKTLASKAMNHSEAPKMVYRSVWGSGWTSNSPWKIWNGAGGMGMQTGHAWSNYIDPAWFNEHPEWFALRDGQRRKGEWVCTSNPALRAAFLERLLAHMDKNPGNPSLSPPDGVSYCQCEVCTAQDDPATIETSSGRIAVTNRYVDFFNYLARGVKDRYPERLLSFYVYADYSKAPTKGMKVEPNLVPWIAPLRYCRIHRINDPDCPSRVALGRDIERWKEAAPRLALRTYNFNPAEVTVPVALLSYWSHDIPYLYKAGFIAINNETLPSWDLYSPHIYLSTRLAYDPEADANALMEDYYTGFYGPGAPHMKAYWTAVDQAFFNLKTHTGSYYAIHLAYTPQLLAELRDHMDKALAATRGTPYSDRVAIFDGGLRNAEQYETLRTYWIAGHIPEAQKVYDELVARGNDAAKRKVGALYTVTYVERFLGNTVKAHSKALAEGKKVVSVLPDEWQFFVDETKDGEAKGYMNEGFDTAGWRTVKTYSAPLDAQGLPDRQTVLWYRTTLNLPQVPADAQLLFGEVDGTSKVYLNGQLVGESKNRRQPFSVPLGAAARPGANTLVVRVDHSQITELFLGGILRPVYLMGS